MKDYGEAMIFGKKTEHRGSCEKEAKDYSIARWMKESKHIFPIVILENPYNSPEYWCHAHWEKCVWQHFEHTIGQRQQVEKQFESKIRSRRNGYLKGITSYTTE